jgi:MFS family permease
MTQRTSTSIPETAKSNQRLAILLAMAMFVLVVDTSLMNVSISAVVRDIGTTVSGVQSAIALEALVSAAFILIGSKVGDLIGRKLAYVLGLLGYAVGALAMAFAQSLTAIIVFWAVVGGLGASLLLPAMQSLIHGNFEGAAQKKAYALVGASAAIAAAVGPLFGGFVTTYLSWRVGFLFEVAGTLTWWARCCPSWPWAASCWVSSCGRKGANRFWRSWPSAQPRWSCWCTGSGAASARGSRRFWTRICSGPRSSNLACPGRCSSRLPWAAR